MRLRGRKLGYKKVGFVVAEGRERGVDIYLPFAGQA